MQPQRLIELIVSNNPSAVKRNLYNAGVANLDIIVSVQNVMNAFIAWQRTQNRTDAEAVVFIAQVLNIPIESVTISGGLLQNEMSLTGKGLQELIISVLSQALGISIQTPESDNTLVMDKKHKVMQFAVFGFAIVGVITVAYWLGKMFKKVID